MDRQVRDIFFPFTVIEKLFSVFNIGIYFGSYCAFPIPTFADTTLPLEYEGHTDLTPPPVSIDSLLLFGKAIFLSIPFSLHTSNANSTLSTCSKYSAFHDNSCRRQDKRVASQRHGYHWLWSRGTRL